MLGSIVERSGNGSASGRMYGSYRNVYSSTTTSDRMRLVEHQNNNLKVFLSGPLFSYLFFFETSTFFYCKAAKELVTAVMTDN